MRLILCRQKYSAYPPLPRILHANSRLIGSTNFTSRLGQHIAQSENGGVYLTDVQKKLKGHLSSQEIGHVFKGTLIKSVRSKEHWESLTKLYIGLGWKQDLTESNVHQAIKGRVPDVKSSVRDPVVKMSVRDPVVKTSVKHSYSSEEVSQPQISQVLNTNKDLSNSEITLCETDHQDLSSIFQCYLKNTHSLSVAAEDSKFQSTYSTMES